MAHMKEYDVMAHMKEYDVMAHMKEYDVMAHMKETFHLQEGIGHMNESWHT